MMWGTEEDEVLAGMRKLFLDKEDVDCSAIVEEEEEDLTIQTMEEGAVLKNLTVAPSRARRVPGIIITDPDKPTTVTCNETAQHKDSDSKDLEDDVIPDEFVKEVENFENKLKSNLEETKAVNLGDSKTVKETRISIHVSPSEKEEYIRQEFDGNPWFHDIKEYMEKGKHLENDTHTQKRTLRRLANNFFQSGGIMYRRTPDLGLLQCVDAKEAFRLLEEIHAGTYIPYMNGFVLAKKILKAGIHAANEWSRRSRQQEHQEYIEENDRQLQTMAQEATIYFAWVSNHSSYINWATPYLLVYGTEVVIPAKVEIPSLRIIKEAELKDIEWVRNWYEKLALIDGKRMNTMCHGRFYQNRMARAFNKKVRSRQFTPGQLVLKQIFPHQDEAKGKFSPNCKALTWFIEY
ncbi:uncharacterized protein [Nicotiana tomentosiformis]|uniref:uncharacterized protein n=1 Tax=Nicotiana tomentosiformis TaxID=4098 RepID=UPI00388C6E88